MDITILSISFLGCDNTESACAQAITAVHNRIKTSYRRENYEEYLEELLLIVDQNNEWRRTLGCIDETALDSAQTTFDSFYSFCAQAEHRIRAIGNDINLHRAAESEIYEML